MSIRLRRAALAALIIILSGCRAAETDLPALYVSGSPSYVQADNLSCISLSIQREGHAPSRLAPAPDLTANIGSVRDMRSAPGGWKALACSGRETGRIHIRASGYEVISPDPFYFVPPEYGPPAGPVAVMGFSLQIDPAIQTVALSSVDVLDAYSIGLAASLYSPTPFLFQGDTVYVGLTLEGTQVPLDLLDVRAEIDAVSDPGVNVIDYDGLDPEAGDAPYYSYGGFFSTRRAMEAFGQPSQWTVAVVFQLATAEPFTVAGTVLAIPPSPSDREAGFRIRPFLARAREDSITVSWETDHESRSFVAYGPTPLCDHVAGGEVERNHMYGWDWVSPLYFDSFFHRVEISGLEPDNKYYYRIIAVDAPTLPEPFFTAGRDLASFSFGVLSDTQKGHDAHAALIERMRGQPIRFLLHAGDLIQRSVSEDWLDFFSIEAPLLKNVPIFPAPGNHDAPGFDDSFARYFPADSLDQAPPEVRGHAYSFDYGPCHFISLNVNLPLSPGYPEYDWLVADLAAAGQDPGRKFTVVFLHYPPVTGFPHVYSHDGDYLVPVFAQNGVDAVFSGHIHVYERSDVNGIVYITCGSGGGDLRDWAPDTVLNPYDVTYHVGYGFIRVDVTEDSMDFFAYDEQGLPVDQLHYTKP
ncbi:MAG TPA: metallophosphoesterase family protein [bacterium]|nr:metallophosphoesterase family protein [bacterium]